MSKLNRILITASFLALFPLGLLGPIYAIFVKNIGGDILQTGLAYGIFSITSGIFIFTIGRSNFFKNNTRPMVFIGYLLLTLGQIGYLFVRTPIHLFITQIIIGIAGGILEPSWDGLFSTNLNAEQATSFWSIWAGGRDIITGIGAFVGGAIVAIFSFKVLFMVMFLFNLSATVVSFSLLKQRGVMVERGG